ncbi:MAG: UDP-N-acetylglucosamine 2-epimerase (non-hydrolyzing) [Candidatus Micrarchaeia archaeon]
MKIAVAFGTRPEIIKCSPIIRELESRGLDYYIIHSNQHYSYELDEVFLKELALPKPKYNLKAGSGTHAEQTAKIMLGIEQVFTKEKPDVLLVQGDTNTVLAAALTAYKLGIRIGHVEAGLRSFDRRMPEEANRVLTDHLADYLFPPTQNAEKNLLDEGVGKHELITSRGSFTPKIFVTGNTSVDATLQNIKLAEEARANALNAHGLKDDGYYLATAHRAENVDDPIVFKEFLEAFGELAREKKVVYAVHPRSRKRLQEFNLAAPEGVELIKPPGYLEFLLLEKHASLILTDSGGVQEEGCALGTPCVVLRKSSDRPESIDAGAAVLGGVTKEGIVAAARKASLLKGWRNPYGDGAAAKKIVDKVLEWSI